MRGIHHCGSALLWLAVLVAPSAAQSMPNALSPGQSPAAAGNGAEMVRTALDAFRARAEVLIIKRVDPTLNDADLEKRRQGFAQLLEERLEEFERSASESLEPLRMDGFLDRDEASRSIGQAADTAWLSFEEAIDATALGHRIPPRPTTDQSSGRYAWDMTKYVVLHRNEPIDFVLLIVAIATGVLVAWVCSRFLARIQSSVEDHDFVVLGSLVKGTRGPLYTTLALAGVAIGLSRFWLPRAAEEAMWIGIKLAFVAASMWLMWTLVSLFAQGLGWMLKTTYGRPDKQSVAVIRKCLHLLVIVVYAVVVAEMVFGVELQNVLIGVGLIGLAVTLAAQDSLKNLFGSLTIVMDRPFRVGDLIHFKGFFGTVEDIGFRSTALRELDGHLVTIPNAEIVREPVQNVDARPWIRRRFRIGLRFDTPTDKVREAIEILEDLLSGREDEPEEMQTHVVFEGFGDSTLNLLVQYCVEPGDYWDAMSRGSDLHLQILERFNNAEIEFAFPTQTTVIETDDARVPLISSETPE